MKTTLHSCLGRPRRPHLVCTCVPGFLQLGLYSRMSSDVWRFSLHVNCKRYLARLVPLKRKRNNLPEPLPLKRHGSDVLLVKDPEIKYEAQLVHDRYGIDFLVVPQHLYAPKSLAQASLAVLGFSELFSRRHMIRFTLRNWLASIIPSFVRKQLSI